MSLDLMDRLISDIIAVTQTLMNSDAMDLAAFQPGAATSVEKEHGSLGYSAQDRHKAKRPIGEGVHRTVC